MKKKYILMILLILLSSVLLAGDRSGEQINWQVLSGGGSVNGTSAAYKLTSTVAQTAVGSGTSASYTLHHGFLQDFSGENFLCGDVDNNGVVNILDIVYYVNWKFKSGPAPIILNSADVNHDGAYNILDIVYLVNYKFKGGPDPACP